MRIEWPYVIETSASLADASVVKQRKKMAEISLIFLQNSFLFCTLVQSYDPICHGNEGFVESEGGELRKKDENRLFMMICCTDIHMPFDNG